MRLASAAFAEQFIARVSLWDMAARRPAECAVRAATENPMNPECFTRESAWHEQDTRNSSKR